MTEPTPGQPVVPQPAPEPVPPKPVREWWVSAAIMLAGVYLMSRGQHELGGLLLAASGIAVPTPRWLTK